MIWLILTKHYSCSESPPLAHLFAECEWRDYISEEYPGNEKGAAWEFELKEDAEKKDAISHHVCGKAKSNSYFIDAVTKETKIPWYELEHPVSFKIITKPHWLAKNIFSGRPTA